MLTRREYEQIKAALSMADGLTLRVSEQSIEVVPVQNVLNLLANWTEQDEPKEGE
jgi:hypothetical protein